MGFGTESTSEAGSQDDEQAPPARRRDVRDGAQGAPRRHPRQLQSHSSAIPARPRPTALETFRTMSDIGRQFPNVRFSPNIFTPYPGIPIWPQLRELGVREPQTLEDWDEHAAGRKRASMAQRPRACPTESDARVFPSAQPARRRSQTLPSPQRLTARQPI